MKFFFFNIIILAIFEENLDFIQTSLFFRICSFFILLLAKFVLFNIFGPVTLASKFAFRANFNYLNKIF